VTVSDEGPGVPVNEREVIWTPFFRGNAAAAQGAGGSGIGLAIVKDLVASMGGRISIPAPSNGRGAVFQVELPGAERATAVAPAVDAALSLRPS
jgi:signal transduction histidine kinase